MKIVVFGFWITVFAVTCIVAKNYIALCAVVFCCYSFMKTKNIHANILILTIVSLFFQNQFIHFEVLGADVHFYLLVLIALFFYSLLEVLILKGEFPHFERFVLLIIFNIFFYCHLLLSSFNRWEFFMVVHNVTVPTLFYFVITSVNIKGDELKSYIADLCLVLSLFSVAVIAQYMGSQVRDRFLDLPPITVAAFILIPLSIVSFTSCYKGAQRLALWAINLLALIITMSRVFVVGYFLILVANHILRLKKYRMFFVLLFGVTLGATIMIFSLDCKFTAVTNEIIDVEQSYQRFTDMSVLKRALCGRMYAYMQSFENFSENTLFGSGLTRGDGFMVTVHNYHLEVLEFVGLLGYVLFFVFLFVHFRNLSNEEMHFVSLTQAFTFVSFIYIANACTNGLFHGFLFSILAISLGFVSLSRHHELRGFHEEL